MKKLLFVTTVGGFIGKFETGSVELLKKMGYELHYAADFTNPVYAQDVKENIRLLESMGLIIHQIDIKKSPFDIKSCIKAARQVKYLIEQYGINALHCHTPMGAVVSRIAVAKLRLKNRPVVVYTAHGFHFYKGAPLINWLVYYPVERLLAHYTDIIITINSEDYRLASKHFGRTTDMAVYKIPGVGYDASVFNKDVRSAVISDKQVITLTTVAELSANKNQLTVLKAINKLVNTAGELKPQRKIRYLICGQSSSGNDEYEKQLRKYISEHRLPGIVELTGYKQDVTDILKKTDIFIFSSVREGLGMAAIEALACGIPVVAAQNRGTLEYIVPGKNGYLYEAMDYNRLAELIKELLIDEDKRKAIGNAAADSVSAFEKNNSICIMNQIYEDMDNRVNERI